MSGIVEGAKELIKEGIEGVEHALGINTGSGEGQKLADDAAPETEAPKAEEVPAATGNAPEAPAAGATGEAV
jgi:hypothetical protein